MKVWLAEKSSFAKELSKVLGNPRRIPGIRHGFDTDGGRVLYARGHLVTLAEPHDYEERFKEWDLSHHPIFPTQWQFKVIEDSVDWYLCIEAGIKGASEVVIATDAGREGEYIAWLILNQLEYRGPKTRFWTSGTDAASIRKALVAILPYQEKANLAVAAQIRAESDWVEGLNLTRVLTKKFAPESHEKPISAGRVQTAVLALIVKRAVEIETFKPTTYYEIEATMAAAGRQFKMHYRPNEANRIMEPAKAMEIARVANGATAPLQVDRQPQQQKPPALFESSSLQIRAYNLWGWTGAKTEMISQSLYDLHKLITYPRTDGVHLLDDQVDDVPTILGNIAALDMTTPVAIKGDKNFIDLSKQIPSPPLIRKDVFSSKKLEESGADHHGIIPTSERADLTLPPHPKTVSDIPGQMSMDERKLYLLIVRQYLAQFHTDCKYEQTTMVWQPAGSVPFTVSGRVTLEPGWRVLFDSADDEADKDEKDDAEEGDQGDLPALPNGTPGQALRVAPVQRITRPPRYYTEGSIVSAMRNLSTVISDPEQRKLLKSAGSIGTKSTWGKTIVKLKEREYILVAKGQLKPSELGRSLVAFCDRNVPQLVDPVSTARLEMMLQEVEKGNLRPKDARLTLQTRNLEAIRKCLEIPVERLSAPVGPKGGLRKANAAADDRPKRPSVPPPPDAIFLDVPFDDRDAVKAMGAKFHGDSKRWWLPRQGADLADLKNRNWLKE